MNDSGVKVDGSKVTIISSGAYYVSGVLNDGQIIVDTDDDGLVRLILNGVDLNNTTGAAIFIDKAAETEIILAENTSNTVSDGFSYVFENPDEEEPNAAIFSKSDLTISGSGSLSVNGNYNDGIGVKDGLTIISGSIDVKSVDDGVRGKDFIALENGRISVTSRGDGLKSDADEDPAKGNISIENGFLDIKSGDDGIHANSSLEINGGEIHITDSYEGLESASITINAGEINITSRDDGINLAGGNDNSGMAPGMDPGAAPRLGDLPGQDVFNYSGDNYLYINGGTILVDADGDGIDINGAIKMSGGTVIVHGPVDNRNGPLDYDAGFTMIGGTIIAVGSSGMAKPVGETSSQNSILINFNSAFPAGTLIHIQNINGEEILTFAPRKQFQSLAFSSPKLVEGLTYVIFIGGSSTGVETAGVYLDGSYTGGTKYTSFTISGLSTRLGPAGNHP